MSSPITLNIDNRVAIITLNRPDVMNAINEPMLPPWVDALEECRSNEAENPELAEAEHELQSRMQLEARQRIEALRSQHRRSADAEDDDDDDDDDFDDDDYDVEVEYQP